MLACSSVWFHFAARKIVLRCSLRVSVSTMLASRSPAACADVVGVCRFSQWTTRCLRKEVLSTVLVSNAPSATANLHYPTSLRSRESCIASPILLSYLSVSSACAGQMLRVLCVKSRLLVHVIPSILTIPRLHCRAACYVIEFIDACTCRSRKVR
jgi:hypothetical protein